MVNGQADAIAPNWGITEPERQQLAEAMALALAAWFPDEQIPVKYVVLLQLAGAGWSIANARRDPTTGKLKPLRLARTKPKPGAAEPEPVVTGGAGGGFTTATG